MVKMGGSISIEELRYQTHWSRGSILSALAELSLHGEVEPRFWAATHQSGGRG